MVNSILRLGVLGKKGEAAVGTNNDVGKAAVWPTKPLISSIRYQLREAAHSSRRRRRREKQVRRNVGTKEQTASSRVICLTLL